MLAGDPETAACEGIASCQALEAIGERGWLSTIAGETAEALLESIAMTKPSTGSGSQTPLAAPMT